MTIGKNAFQSIVKLLARCLVVIAAAAFLTSPALAEPTDVTVRVIAKGAKFVGDGMGGVRIILRDAETGTILAEGLTEGDTGDTKRIMETPLKRGEPFWTPGAAAFNARLDINAPLKVRVEATGPLSHLQAAVTVSSEQWVAPGFPVTGGDAWLLELPGLAVDILSPIAQSDVSAAAETIEIAANVVMMCGCVLTPGGLWDADTFEIVALIYRDGEKIDETILAYAGEPGRFYGSYAAPELGAYRIVVVAYDETSGNTGVDQVIVNVD